MQATPRAPPSANPNAQALPNPWLPAGAAAAGTAPLQQAQAGLNFGRSGMPAPAELARMEEEMRDPMMQMAAERMRQNPEMFRQMLVRL